MTGWNQYTDHDEPGAPMSSEEFLARSIFKAAGYVRVTDYKVWTPSKALWEAYDRGWLARQRPMPGDPDAERLGPRQVGAIIHMVFPAAIPVTRRVAPGLSARGWAFIGGGPASIRVGGEKDPQTA